MMLSGLTDDAEMVSRTKVTSVIYTQTHLTANLKLTHVSVCVCVPIENIFENLSAYFDGKVKGLKTHSSFLKAIRLQSGSCVSSSVV